MLLLLVDLVDEFVLVGDLVIEVADLVILGGLVLLSLRAQRNHGIWGNEKGVLVSLADLLDGELEIFNVLLHGRDLLFNLLLALEQIVAGILLVLEALLGILSAKESLISSAAKRNHTFYLFPDIYPVFRNTRVLFQISLDFERETSRYLRAATAKQRTGVCFGIRYEHDTGSF